MTFDPSLPVQRRDGSPAKIVYRELTGQYPIVAIHEDDDGERVVRIHKKDGTLALGFSGCGADLVNIPETVTTYQNVGPHCAHSSIWSTRALADANAADDRIAVLIIRTTDGVTTVELEHVRAQPFAVDGLKVAGMECEPDPVTKAYAETQGRGR